MFNITIFVIPWEPQNATDQQLRSCDSWSYFSVCSILGCCPLVEVLTSQVRIYETSAKCPIMSFLSRKQWHEMKRTIIVSNIFLLGKFVFIKKQRDSALVDNSDKAGSCFSVCRLFQHKWHLPPSHYMCCVLILNSSFKNTEGGHVFVE